mgnify:CR=1 FL=1
MTSLQLKRLGILFSSIYWFVPGCVALYERSIVNRFDPGLDLYNLASYHKISSVRAIFMIEEILLVVISIAGVVLAFSQRDRIIFFLHAIFCVGLFFYWEVALREAVEVLWNLDKYPHGDFGIIPNGGIVGLLHGLFSGFCGWLAVTRLRSS